MNALLFRKYLELKNNKSRLIAFFVLPFACFIATCYFRIPQDKVDTYFILTTSLLAIFIFWNPENVYFSYNIILTPLSPRNAWVFNSLITSISYYIYTFVCYIICKIIYCNIFNLNIFSEHMLYGMLTLIPTIGIILFSSLSSVENTTIKQWLASPISLINAFSFIIFLFCYQVFPIGINIMLFLNLFGIFLIILSLFINKKISNEKIFLCSDKILSINKSRTID